MKRELYDDVQKVLNAIDEYIVNLGRKHSFYYHDGYEYVSIEPEEEDVYVAFYSYSRYDQKVWSGKAVCAELVEIEETEGAESLDELEFYVPVYTYTRDEEDEIISMEWDDSLKWSGDCLCSFGRKVC